MNTDIIDYEERVVELTRSLISIPSLTGHEDEIAKYLRDFLEDNGVAVELDEYGNVVAVEGEGSPVLVFNGHMDTVPPSEGWERDPFEPWLVGDRIYGLGSSDMKGGLAALTLAFLALRKKGFKGTLVYTAVVGEEGGEKWGSEYVASRGVLSRMNVNGIIVGEGSVFEKRELALRVGHGGSVRFKIIFNGKAYHSSRPEMGVNAIYRAVDFIEAISNLNSAIKPRILPIVTVNKVRKGVVSVTMIKGGRKINVVPDRCEVYVDRRLVYGEDVEEAIAQIKGIAESLVDKHKHEYDTEEKCVKVEVEIFPKHRPPYMIDLSTDGGRRLYDIAITAFKEVLGKEPHRIYTMGYTDAEILSYYTKAPALIIGPGEVAHVPNEYVKIENLINCLRIYYTLGRLFLR